MTDFDSLAQHRLHLAQEVLHTEADAIRVLAQRLDHTFLAAIEAILQCQGRVIVTGMGKSGHIARKIAATLASTGTPAFFIHPAEAAHGDLGMITDGDVVLALSNSGESEEIVALLPSLRRKNITLLAMTGRPQSTLAKEADYHLNAAVDREACPHNLAPTTSTTAALAFGDAIAMVLLDARGFQPEDFALSHPGGSLGRRLLVHVSDIMHQGDALPVVTPDTLLRDALMEISRKGLGMTAVADQHGTLLGVFTDGDLRRALDHHADVHATLVGELMTTRPRTIAPHRLAAEAVQLMQTHKIFSLLVCDEQQRLLGALTMHDLLRAGIV